MLIVEGGYVMCIEGGVDVDLLCDYMDMFVDFEGYVILYIGWGL